MTWWLISAAVAAISAVSIWLNYVALRNGWGTRWVRAQLRRACPHCTEPVRLHEHVCPACNLMIVDAVPLEGRRSAHGEIRLMLRFLRAVYFEDYGREREDILTRLAREVLGGERDATATGTQRLRDMEAASLAEARDLGASTARIRS